ncbi:MAG: hypothetical protein ACOYOD_08800 [Saprospiraceae bacterium]|jgi:hypothetical protein
MNNFKQLLEENEKQIPESALERILHNVWGSEGFLDTVEDAADRYFIRIADVVFGRSSDPEGGTTEQGPPDQYPTVGRPSLPRPGIPGVEDTPLR